MLKGLKHLWRSHKLLLIAFMLAASLTIAFGVRMLLFSIYWSDPNHQNQPLEGWMTPRYVAFSYGLDRQDVRRILELDPNPLARETLRDIVKKQNATLDALQNRLDDFVASRAVE